jgi:hypothetical protein
VECIQRGQKVQNLKNKESPSRAQDALDWASRILRSEARGSDEMDAMDFSLPNCANAKPRFNAQSSALLIR